MLQFATSFLLSNQFFWRNWVIDHVTEDLQIAMTQKGDEGLPYTLKRTDRIMYLFFCQKKKKRIPKNKKQKKNRKCFVFHEENKRKEEKKER